MLEVKELSSLPTEAAVDMRDACMSMKMGNTRYYTKANGESFAELTYDAWGMPESPNKLLNNEHGNYVYATYTGHIFDTTLDIYFAEARFHDANTRTWLALGLTPYDPGQPWANRNQPYASANCPGTGSHLRGFGKCMMHDKKEGK